MMAGAYCKFCDQRCFVFRVIPGGQHRGEGWHLATCARGLALDQQKLGYTHLTAINPMTQPVILEPLEEEATDGQPG